MGQTDPSKTEKATPKRRDKQRGEGNVAKSQEFTKVCTLFAGIIGLYAYFPYIVEQIRDLFLYYFQNAAMIEVNESTAYALIVMGILDMAIMVMPILLIVGVAAFVVLKRQVGDLWTTQVFFKWKPNLIGGLQRMFASPQTFVRLGKSAAQALVIGLVPFYFIRNEAENFLPMYHANASIMGSYMLRTGFRMVLYTLVPMTVIALVDLWYSFWSYEERIKMTKQEIKDENKQSEGDPLIKQKQRQKMMQVMSSRMMKEVPKADVVITNPTHYAVALRYDPTVSPAPMVVAKGMNKVAEKIKTIAREHHIPIRENRPLARSLYKQVEVGDPIPEDLYKAVATLLAEIWRMQGKMPTRPS